MAGSSLASRICWSKLIVASTLLCLLFGAQGSSATALTTYLQGNEKSCFYADVDGIGEKVGFYFSVQSGGSFDIDYTVQSPSEKVILEGTGERQGDYIFTANTVGEYSFCFENESSMTAKLIDFDIMVESEPRRSLPVQQGSIAEHTSSLEESIYKLNGMLSNLVRTQKYFHTRHHRNHSTVLSTESRIFWYSILESLAIAGIAFAQVWVLKSYFGRTGR
ncbi:hypothetical protein FFLO_02083 [Filobasidium floriforme]|uniref:GOLD domain-containing protein n=2 Tax=Filobasidium floriforme TaxID=5210 RepID=A0A8K0NS44_9TREE|nr:hypothetical protein FFLO_02083 [Filobasidium floriforme]